MVFEMLTRNQPVHAAAARDEELEVGLLLEIINEIELVEMQHNKNRQVKIIVIKNIDRQRRRHKIMSPTLPIDNTSLLFPCLFYCVAVLLLQFQPILFH